MVGSHKFGLSLRQKAILGIGFTYAAIVSIFAFSAVLNEQKIVKEEMMNTSMGCTRLFAKMVTEPLLQKDIQAIQMHVRQAGPMAKFSHGRNVSYVIIQDETGHVVASSGEEKIKKYLRGEINLKAFSADSEIIQDVGSVVDVAIPIFANGEKKGVVRLGISTKDMEKKILQSRRWALQFMLGAIVLGAVLGLFVDRKVKGNLSNLIETAARMADGDLNQRVNIKTGDEMEAFGIAFNKMADKLQEAHENLEHKVAERTRQLRESQAQLVHQEKMASLGVLAAGLAHEIGNPLTSISSVVQILQRKVQDKKIIQQLQLLNEHIRRISKTVRELVDFSRPTKSELRPVQINDLIRTALGILKYDKRAKNIKLETHLDHQLPRLTLIEDQILQVFINFILNAFDAMEQGGTLTITTSLENESVCICFQDTGVGIPEDVQKKIFEPFFTTKPVGKGSGLGLSVSYGLIQNFGGTIEVESTVGKGAKFTVSLPVRTEV
ncbi:MAG: HAMP domain-containing protein [Calditrichaeota bacterium]|nr:MAG: HAMP domain-containing protein [Calditrichota bacterium]